ncbi:MAG: hypothetical protein JXA67_19000 [Micromonosporaceae bacterium]|nr:hypothetical protein [Micromonosporaceae bacterium]
MGQLIARLVHRMRPLAGPALLRLPRSRVAPYAFALVAAGISVLALLPEPPEGAPPQPTDFVIVVGAAGLRWDDLDPDRTPTLWGLAERGAIGALSVRSAGETTCPADGWLTLGAGNLAQRTDGPMEGECPQLAVPIEQASAADPGAGAGSGAGAAGSGEATGTARSEGVTVRDQSEVVSANRELSWEVQPGALAEAVRCTTAIGEGAAIAAARPFGRVDRYAEDLDEGLGQHLRVCPLSIIDAGTVEGSGATRDAGVEAADDALAAVLAVRPSRSLVMVAGLSDTADVGRLHVAIAEGPGYGRGWLMSRTTGRLGYVQLVDLAPTVLAALDRPIPNELFIGATVSRAGQRPDHLAEAVARLADADQQAGVQRVVAARFLIVLAVGQLILFWAVASLLRWVSRSPGPALVEPVPGRVLRLAEVALVAAALAVPAALVADLVPWWRWPLPNLVFAGVTAVVLAITTAGIVRLTRRQRATGPLGAVAAVAAVAVAADVMTGSRLQLNGVAGYSAATSGRYAGLGTIGLGVLVAGALLLAGALATQVPRRWRPCVVAAVGAIGVVVVGSPYLGADASGAVALSAGVCLAAAAASGGWLTGPRIAAAAATAVVVTTGFALLDLRRPEAQRSNIGRFLVDLGDGTRGGLEGQHLGEHNVTTMASSPLTLLVIGSMVVIWFVLLRPTGGLRRVFGLYPAVRASLGGMCVATLFAGLVEGVGLNVLGAAAATAMPLVVLAALRVLEHARDRTPSDDHLRSVSERCDTARPGTDARDEVLA